MSLQSCLTLCDPIDCSPPGSSVHGILQARILEWAAMPSSRGSSRPRDQTCVSYVSCIVRQVLYHWCHQGSQHYTKKMPVPWPTSYKTRSAHVAFRLCSRSREIVSWFLEAQLQTVWHTYKVPETHSCRQSRLVCGRSAHGWVFLSSLWADGQSKHPGANHSSHIWKPNKIL